MEEYHLIIVGGLVLAKIGYDIYINIQEKKTIKEFDNWVHNYVIPKAEELRESNNELKGLISKLKEKTSPSSQ